MDTWAEAGYAASWTTEGMSGETTVPKSEWLACTDPQKMLAYLWGRARARKQRLLVCACCRRIWHLLSDESARHAVEVAERYTDGLIGDREWSDVYYALSEYHATTENDPAEYVAATAVLTLSVQFLSPGFHRFITRGVFNAMRAGARVFSSATGEFDSSDDCSMRMAREKTEQAVVVRDLFGNPFRPATISPAVLAWNDAVIVRLAQAAYDERHLPAGSLDNSRLAVLADALEEAGCTDADMLDHLRSPGPYVRGCWPVDLCLGKS
jgi:hypothetical protein